MRIRDGKNSDLGWKKFGSGINISDTYATLLGDVQKLANRE
jgi:hypothetical protein